MFISHSYWENCEKYQTCMLQDVQESLSANVYLAQGRVSFFQVLRNSAAKGGFCRYTIATELATNFAAEF